MKNITRYILLICMLTLAIGSTQCNKGASSRWIPLPLYKTKAMSVVQNDILQAVLDESRRANNSFPVVLRNGSGTVSNNTYLLTMYYPDHISYLDYDIEVTGNSEKIAFKSFDNGATFRLLHASGIDDTHIELVFNRAVNATDGANVSLFTVPGLTVSAAQVDGTNASIVLLTTGSQGDDTDYSLTVDAAFRDSGDTAMAAGGNAASFKGFAATALPTVRDAYMRTPAQIRVVFGSAPGSYSYTVSLKLDGVMRYEENGDGYTYPNVIAIHNYGILVAMEKQFYKGMAGYDSLLGFARVMGDDLIIMGQAVAGKSGLDRRRPADTFYLVKLYQVSGDAAYLSQAQFNFDNEISVLSYGGSAGGEAWAKKMVTERTSLAGYDAGFYMNSALALASVNRSYPGAKDFAKACADYLIANESGWVNVDYGGNDYTRISTGAFCFYLTELVRLYPDLKPAYSAAIVGYATEIMGWQDAAGYFADGNVAGFDPQTTAFCLLALKGAQSGYGIDDADAVQAVVSYLESSYLNTGTVGGGWYDVYGDLYNEPVSELIWALSI